MKIGDLFMRSANAEIRATPDKARRLSRVGKTAEALEEALRVIGRQQEVIQHFLAFMGTKE
jgi:hypothetical protein